MSDQGIAIEDGASRVGWFIAGALSVIALIGVFLAASAYLSQPSTAATDANRVVIEGY